MATDGGQVWPDTFNKPDDVEVNPEGTLQRPESPFDSQGSSGWFNKDGKTPTYYQLKTADDGVEYLIPIPNMRDFLTSGNAWQECRRVAKMLEEKLHDFAGRAINPSIGQWGVRSDPEDPSTLDVAPGDPRRWTAKYSGLLYRTFYD